MTQRTRRSLAVTSTIDHFYETTKIQLQVKENKVQISRS